MKRFQSKLKRIVSPKSDSLRSTTRPSDLLAEGLYRLFPANENDASSSEQNEYPVDIIAIHGLNGNAYSTWTHKPDGTLWLRDLLPSFLPGCRVYTYNYPSRVFSESFARLQDFARGLLVKIRDLHEDSNTVQQIATDFQTFLIRRQGSRPIIFVCHSLGGIVFKQALVLAHQDEALYAHVLNSVIGVAFLGTPHRGSEVASFASIIGTIINAFTVTATAGIRQRPVRTDLLDHLRFNSDVLQDLILAARGRLQNLTVVSFHELNPTSPLSSLIVDRTSATLGIANEELIPMYEDHRSICRFAGETQSYKKVAHAIRRIASQSLNLAPPFGRASMASSNGSLSDTERACLRLLQQNGHLNLDDEKVNGLKPLPGTCQWIRSHELFISFLGKGGSAMLWLTGHPGCGKTTMSFSLGQYLEESHMDKRSLIVLTYFCTSKYSKQTDARVILIGLILQIINRHRSMISHVEGAFEMQGPSIVESFSSLWKIFMKIVKSLKSGTLYIILDALDECEDKSCRNLLGAISDMLKDSTPVKVGVKFLITSRPFLYQTYFGPDQILQPQISIDDGQTGYVTDVERFIQQRVDEISFVRQYPSKVKEYLLETIRSKAGQTFLWVHIVLVSVEESLLTSISDFRNIISSIPDELADIYKRYLSGIPSGHRIQASRLIKLLLSSSRPLELNELNIAFTINDSHGATNDVEVDAQTAFPHTVQGVLGPLVRVHRSTVSLVHQSLKEFLLEAAKEPDSFCALHSVTSESAALQISSACIQYLLLDDFRDDFFSTDSIPNLYNELPFSDPSDDSWDEDNVINPDLLFHDPDTLNPMVSDSMKAKHGFYSYAALHWTEHFAICEDFASEELKRAARELLDIGRGSCRNWLQFHRAQAVNFLDDGDIDRHPAVLAVYFNLRIALAHILEGGIIYQMVKDRSLFWAARLGHNHIIDTLLQAGADPNSPQVRQQTALPIAAEYGHLKCVTSLLGDKGTEINSGGRNGKTALSFACASGHVAIVKELLNRKDCTADHIDNSGTTPMIWAIGGDLKIISTLAVHPGVNVNHRDKSGRTAFSWAAGSGRDDVVEYFLSLPNIDASMKDKKGKSPLSWAAGNGYATTIALLLNSTKVDTFSVDETGRNAISWAAGGGHYDALITLFNKDKLDADAADETGWTPLAWAIHVDSPRTIQALITIGRVEVDRRDHSGRTALNWAVEYGHSAVVEVLLQAGANPDLKSDRGASAISTALQHGRNNLLYMLQEHSTEKGSA